jgi:hypothetical protein
MYQIAAIIIQGFIMLIIGYKLAEARARKYNTEADTLIISNLEKSFVRLSDEVSALRLENIVLISKIKKLNEEIHELTLKLKSYERT